MSEQGPRWIRQAWARIPRGARPFAIAVVVLVLVLSSSTAWVSKSDGFCSILCHTAQANAAHGSAARHPGVGCRSCHSSSVGSTLRQVAATLFKSGRAHVPHAPVYDAACTSIDTSSWIPLENVHYTGIDLWKRAYEEEKETFISSSGTDSLYPVFPYSKTRHLFNIHSWTPFYLPSINIAPEPAKVAPGITLYSQNILGTAVAYAGTAYRNDIQKFMSYAGFTYYGFFPVFNASIGYGGQQTVHEEEGIPYNGELMPAGYIRGIMYVPMNFSRGKYYCGLVPETGIYYANSLKYDREKGLYDKGYTRNISRLQFYRYLKKTDLDIVPRKGVGADLLYAYSPWENRFYGELWSFSVSGYLPGIFKHQSLKLMAGAEYQTPRQYILSGIQRPARGYDNDTAWLKQTTYYSSLQKITLDYILPLCYPDVSLFDIIYIRRFRTNLFFDHSQGKFRDPDTRTYINRELNSAGIEVTCDFHLFHIQSPIGISYRYAYLLGHQTYTWGIYFNVDLLNF